MSRQLSGQVLLWVTGPDIGAFRAKAGLAETCEFRYQGDKVMTSHLLISQNSKTGNLASIDCFPSPALVSRGIFKAGIYK